MWEQAQHEWHSAGIIEFGIYQIDTKSGVPKWRRHNGRQRFATVWNALFSDKGAREACLGTSPYPKARYAAGTSLLVPYVAVWLQGGQFGFLVRPSAGDPEVTLLQAQCLEAIRSATDQEQLTTLANLFARGASENGVGWLSSDRISRP
jgi:hypothetical protein